MKGAGDCSHRPAMAIESHPSQARLERLDGDLSQHMFFLPRSQYTCQQAGCSDMCRCGVITGVQWNGTEDQQILDVLFPDLTPWKKGESKDAARRRVDAYAYGRILSGLKLNEDSLEWQAKSGYYGQELSQTRLRPEARYAFSKQVNDYHQAVDNQPLSAAAEYMLVHEYGHLLPRLTGAHWELRSLPLHDIRRPSRRQAERVQSNPRAAQYSKIFSETSPTDAHSNIPLCMAEERDGRFTLLDGYHRTEALLQSNRINGMFDDVLTWVVHPRGR